MVRWWEHSSTPIFMQEGQSLSLGSLGMYLAVLWLQALSTTYCRAIPFGIPPLLLEMTQGNLSFGCRAYLDNLPRFTVRAFDVEMAPPMQSLVPDSQLHQVETQQRRIDFEITFTTYFPCSTVVALPQPYRTPEICIDFTMAVRVSII